MRAIIKDQVIQASPLAVWAALTDPEAIRRWMGADTIVEVDLRPGGRYRLFDGETTGSIRSFEPGKRLSYTWRQEAWDTEWPDSLVEWTLAPSGAGTHVHLVHDQLPNEHERDMHAEGWDLYFLEPMKQALEEQG